MINQLSEPDFGYNFLPGTANRFPGHPQLDIILREVPTERHFDPEQVHFEAAQSGRPEALTITHPWTGPRQHRICAGRIYIDDRKHKRVEAFSFGGTLEITTKHDLTICRLSSTTPILDMMELDSLSTTIATEAEVLLAERRADWDPKHPHTFEQHLATAVPLELYACILAALHEKFAPHLEHFDQVYHQLVAFAAGEMAYLQQTGQWPAVVPPLTEIL
ncbi:MAG: hypothetical protein H6667_25840 [Ardenticatenaceae bacterium]|nr:hypothetical protein [Ardenticatenaceae bacterium]MCB9445484.1 hypothetical protein [Ardenticatenaceae bacterium]